MTFSWTVVQGGLNPAATSSGKCLHRRSLRDVLPNQTVREEALKVLPVEPGYRAQDVLVAAVDHASEAEIQRVSELSKASILKINDPEDSFWAAEVFAACGRTRDALDLLQTMAPRQFCADPAIDRIPAFASIHTMPEFLQIRNDAIQCRQRFVQWRAANTP